MAGDGQGHGQSPFTPQANGGEFLLSLLQRPTNRPSQSQSPNPQLQIDPAVAAIGPSITSLQPPWPSNGSDLLYPVPLSPWPPHSSHHSLSTPVPPNFIGFQQLHNPFPPPPPHNHFSGTQYAATQSSLDDSKRLGFSGNHDKLQFGSFSPTLIPQVMVNGNSSVHNLKREAGFGESIPNGFNRNQQLDSHVNSSFNSYGNSNVNVHALHHGEFNSSDPRRGGGLGENNDGGNQHLAKAGEGPQPLPGFPSKAGGNWDLGNIMKRDLELGLNKEKVFLGGFGFNDERGNRFSGRDGKVYGERSHGFELDHHGRHSKSSLQSVSAFDTEATMLNLHSEIVEGRDRDRHQGRGWMKKDVDSINGNVNQELDNIGEQLVDSLLHDDEPDEKTDAKHIRREKDCRGDHLLTQRMRLYKRRVGCRGDIDMLTIPLLSIYQSLIPPKEEKEKQKQLLTSLEKLVVKEWPSAHLCLFGSCANSFGVSNSDIDICLVLRKPNIDKSEIILKLADILQSANHQNVQALTRARVPIIKLKDLGTGISCDICINNVLAVVNTKLLRDYAQIDVRLQQLAFIVKHWAKSRGVNETYQGTLSSYAYVLMCIHFLQHRRPAILPCLQEMQITFHELVDDVECAYFDKVEQLETFGSHNKESIAQLVWGFFNYWAYGHDYANAVISVRTGSIISKRAKDWTRRVGNDRHLICIEDPFETSHDLGRVVDKYSIRVLREEFERAAEILQYDPNPCERLFEPYIPI